MLERLRMSAPNATEQYLLELINDARLNPLGDAARYISSYNPLTSPDSSIQNNFNFWGVNGTALLSAFSSLTPVQPLAWNGNLGDAATTHNNLMIANNSQSHQLPGEADLGTRFNAAGYTGWNAIAENIFGAANNALAAHAGFMVDWGSGPNGMQSPAGHRNNIMNSTYREIGISAIAENNPATTNIGPLTVTQDFGYRSGGPQVFILGVDYNDTDGNKFYSIGEGVGGLSISTTGASTTSAASGGYTLGVTAGVRTLTYSGGGLAGPVTVQGNFANGTNAKIDIVSGNKLLTSHSITVEGPVTTIEALGLTGLNITAGSGNQTMTGTVGGDTLSGGEGNDTIGGGAGNDALFGGNGDDNLSGDAGADFMYGGAGNDRFVVDTYAGEAVIENANEGTDVVYAMIDYTVGPNIEQVILVEGSAARNAGGAADDNVIIGNSANNVIYGYGGNDTLSGGGGDDSLLGGAGNDAMDGEAGNDTMIGGLGDDRYVVDSVSDTVVENPGEGTDVVYAKIDYTLGGNVEQLIMMEGTAARNAAGDSGDNTIIGNSANNVIYGNNGNDTLMGDAGLDSLVGGNGNDILVGGTGNDSLVGGANADIFKFAAGDGLDTVQDFSHAEGDKIMISNAMSSTFADVMAHASVSSGHVVLSWSGGAQQIALLSVTSTASLQASDFLFY